MDFFDLGVRHAVDKALSRMVAARDIRRITRGLYDLPRHNTLTGKPTNPNRRGIIVAPARRDKARMVVDGLTAANDLGLSDAVPATIAVHTDARQRPIKLGAQTIAFKPTAPRKLYWAGALACALSRPSTGCATCSAAIINGSQAAWRPSCADSELGSAIAEDLREDLTSLPDWMQNFLPPFLGQQKTGRLPGEALHASSRDVPMNPAFLTFH